MVAADLLELGKDARLVAREGSEKKNPTWKEEDFKKFAAFARKINPVLECKGDTKVAPKMMAKAWVPDDDVECLWAMCTIPTPHIIAEKRFAPGEKPFMEFEIPETTAFVIIYQKSQNNKPCPLPINNSPNATPTLSR